MSVPTAHPGSPRGHERVCADTQSTLSVHRPQVCEVTSALRCICDQRSPPGPVPSSPFSSAQRGGGRGLPAGGGQAASASGSSPHTICGTVCGPFSAASSLCLCSFECALLTAPQSPVKCRPGLGGDTESGQPRSGSSYRAAQTLSQCLQTETLTEQSDSLIIGWKRRTGRWQEPNPVFPPRARAQGSPIGIGVTS